MELRFSVFVATRPTNSRAVEVVSSFELEATTSMRGHGSKRPEPGSYVEVRATEIQVCQLTHHARLNQSFFFRDGVGYQD